MARPSKLRPQGIAPWTIALSIGGHAVLAVGLGLAEAWFASRSASSRLPEHTMVMLSAGALPKQQTILPERPTRTPDAPEVLRAVAWAVPAAQRFAPLAGAPPAGVPGVAGVAGVAGMAPPPAGVAGAPAELVSELHASSLQRLLLTMPPLPPTVSPGASVTTGSASSGSVSPPISA